MIGSIYPDFGTGISVLNDSTVHFESSFVSTSKNFGLFENWMNRKVLSSGLGEIFSVSRRVYRYRTQAAHTSGCARGQTGCVGMLATQMPTMGYTSAISSEQRSGSTLLL
jgi:hypothetical protein